MTDVCPSCPHPVREHSPEPGVGCLHMENHIGDDGLPYVTGPHCPCFEPGNSAADQ